jgi:hypothetical protein
MVGDGLVGILLTQGSVVEALSVSLGRIYNKKPPRPAP